MARAPSQIIVGSLIGDHVGDSPEVMVIGDNRLTPCDVGAYRMGDVTGISQGYKPSGETSSLGPR